MLYRVLRSNGIASNLIRLWISVLISLSSSCTGKDGKLVESGSAGFRITLNYNRELTIAEIDSIEKTNPAYLHEPVTGDFYLLLMKKGFVSKGSLDTSGFAFVPITWESPSLAFREMTVELDTASGNDHLIVTTERRSVKALLRERLLGDRFISCFDMDNDGKMDIIVMEKYYIMGGYNFDLKYFRIE